jgi:hypothetical protein
VARSTLPSESIQGYFPAKKRACPLRSPPCPVSLECETTVGRLPGTDLLLIGRGRGIRAIDPSSGHDRCDLSACNTGSRTVEPVVRARRNDQVRPQPPLDVSQRRCGPRRGNHTSRLSEHHNNFPVSLPQNAFPIQWNYYVSRSRQSFEPSSVRRGRESTTTTTITTTTITTTTPRKASVSIDHPLFPFRPGHESPDGCSARLFSPLPLESSLILVSTPSRSSPLSLRTQFCRPHTRSLPTTSRFHA